MTDKELLALIEHTAQTKTFWLYLNNRQITRLPPEIGKLTHLNDLNLSNNQLTELPPEIGKLTHLTRLDVSHNQLTELPPEIGKLTRLTQFSARNNQLTELPDGVGQLVQLTRLYLSSNQLTVLPSRLGRLALLRELDVSHNRLSLPETPPESTISAWLKFFTQTPSLEQLTSLEVLNLRNNELTTLPFEITQLMNLRELNVGDNHLKQLPEGLGNLILLKRLFLNENRLTELPSEINHLASLEQLDICDNRLIELPLTIGELPRLRELRLNHNELVTLPPEIGHLQTLERLLLRHNKLSSLPASLRNLTNLKQLVLHENLLNIPPEIINRTDHPQMVINFYLQHHGTAKRPLNEAKMILVGLGDVGKTSIARRLIENRFNPHEPKTEGIEIQQWPIGLGEQSVRLNLWDFGGQEIMHATHQFFLTQRTLYLLVIDARQGEPEQNLEYWLKLLQSFGGDSPIIIVINKIDANLLELDERGLRAKYPTVRAIIATSCKTGKGIRTLRRQIVTEISQLEHVHDELLLSWFAVKTQLEVSERDYIPYNDYIRMCEAQRIGEPLDQQTLIRLLHDLGVVLSFQDDRRLRETNILRPAWVTNGVYQILNAHLLFQQRGVLEIEQLNDILEPQQYPPHKHLFIMDMMRKFELCFDFDGYPDQRFLIPDLLQVAEPYLPWEADNSLQFAYHYEVLPSSVISRFIVRIHRVLQLKSYWRNGVVVTDTRNQALVRADREARKITISVMGEPRQRRNMLAIIRAHFDHIHATIPRLMVTSVIQLPDFPGVTIDYEDLLRLEERGINRYYYPKADAEIDVIALLNGFKAIDHVPPTTTDPLATLRARLHSQFPTLNDLRFFCYDHPDFVAVYQQAPVTKTAMIQAMVAHAKTIGKLDVLYGLDG